MGSIAIGQPVPDIELLTTDDQSMRFSDLAGKNIVLYFYPKDNTPGCTVEGQDFRDSFEEFRKLNTEILGVSRDSIKSHEGFRSRNSFPFDLVSDTSGSLCELFDVIREKKLYGKKYMGIERSTFIIDRTGILRHEFRGVKVDGHVAHVLTTLRSLPAHG